MDILPIGPLARKWLVFLLALLCQGPLLAAPAPRWTPLSATDFKHTPTPITAAIAQDRSGFLWYGTQSGLLRWDGHAFRRYTADSSKTRAIPDNFILSVHVDGGGTCTTQVLVRQIQQVLVVRVAVDGIHESVLDAK